MTINDSEDTVHRILPIVVKTIELQVAPIPAAGSHGEIYDAVWTMALALRGLIR